ncbi:MAG: ABC transporter permease [SAR116 cluster bacterium]|nr:ABC transporter permease [SAR116 cluster bacterium]HCP18330.1 ABC transporter permease [Alphaproteobacteria bacterium]
MAYILTLFWVIVAVLVSLGAGWCFRAALIQISGPNMAKIYRTAPLTASFGLLVIVIYILCAIFAPLIAPYGEAEILSGGYMPWSQEFWLGTDNLGRDVFSRLIYGARNTVGIAFLTTALAFIFGTIIGIYAALRGGFIDQVLSRLIDVLMAIPSLIFSLLMLTIFGTNVLTLVIVIATIDSTRVFRIARAVALNIVQLDYIEAAKLRGENTLYLIIREILPNAMAPLAAEFGLRFCFVFLMISALSFMGLGLQPPLADWGSMVRDNADLISFGDITPLIPAGAIALLTIAVNFVVDWMLHRASGLKD